LKVRPLCFFSLSLGLVIPFGASFQSPFFVLFFDPPSPFFPRDDFDVPHPHRGTGTSLFSFPVSVIPHFRSVNALDAHRSTFFFLLNLDSFFPCTSPGLDLPLTSRTSLQAAVFFPLPPSFYCRRHYPFPLPPFSVLFLSHPFSFFTVVSTHTSCSSPSLFGLHFPLSGRPRGDSRPA